MPPHTPEAAARERIDATLHATGWAVQDRAQLNLGASRGVAVREFPLRSGYGTVDYLLYVDRRPAGVVEAKAEGATLSGVEVQTGRYSEGLPEKLPAPVRPLPFLYQSTGIETRFTNLLDPEPRSRPVFAFHRPETLAEQLFGPGAAARGLASGQVWGLAAERPATLRARLRTLPPLDESGLWPAQARAIRNLERSLAEDRPRALIQMATGSGKTFTAVTSIYRLIRYAEARRVLFLVDRANLGRQALKEFKGYRTPEGRLFSELYNVQHLTSNRPDRVARVCISTVQRFYSILRGEPELAPELDEKSPALLEQLYREPLPVEYNRAFPPEYFDFVWIDECHRSIYTVWRQVLEYFDAYLIGLTATPSKQTFGFFRRNLVMEYGHAQAVADRVNVDFDVYRIRTRITEEGGRLEAGEWVGRRHRATREMRWERLDEPFAYDPAQLDRHVEAEDQIRTVIRAFRDALPQLFPDRTEVPKTLIFAKDDNHAERIVEVVRQEFGKGNEFAQKITYRTTGETPENLIQAFRTQYHPRIAVTVDMIATGTDIKPFEVVVFLRAVRSRTLFEQMKGRGVRVIREPEFRAVTPEGMKTRFVIVDAVGVTEMDLSDTHSLDRKPSVSLDALLQAVAQGSTDAEVGSTLASRLNRLDLALDDAGRETLAEAAGGTTLRELTAALLAALDPDRQAAAARERFGLPAGALPEEAQLDAVAGEMVEEALRPLADNPGLRQTLLEVRRALERTVDEVSQDEVLEAGFSPEAAERARIVAEVDRRLSGVEKLEAEVEHALVRAGRLRQAILRRAFAGRLVPQDPRAEPALVLLERIRSEREEWSPRSGRVRAVERSATLL